jgi:GH15 family glucan-1,4-alpha-glucosidase
MEATVRTVESELMVGRGVHRHPGDEFYGGGLWVVLAALLGWHYAKVRRLEEAHAELDWIAAAASADGELAEQLEEHLLHPRKRAEWVERWGPPARPLLWSHALFLALALELETLSLEDAA